MQTVIDKPKSAPPFLYLPTYSTQIHGYPGREFEQDWHEAIGYGAGGWELLWRLENKNGGVIWLRR